MGRSLYQIRVIIIIGLVEMLHGTTSGGGGGANPIFPVFPIPISEKSTFVSGKSGNSFSPISPSLITLGRMLIHNFYINVLIALILVYRNSM